MYVKWSQHICKPGKESELLKERLCTWELRGQQGWRRLRGDYSVSRKQRGRELHARDTEANLQNQGISLDR